MEENSKKCVLINKLEKMMETENPNTVFEKWIGYSTCDSLNIHTLNFFSNKGINFDHRYDLLKKIYSTNFNLFIYLIENFSYYPQLIISFSITNISGDVLEKIANYYIKKNILDYDLLIKCAIYYTRNKIQSTNSFDMIKKMVSLVSSTNFPFYQIATLSIDKYINENIEYLNLNSVTIDLPNITKDTYLCPVIYMLLEKGIDINENDLRDALFEYLREQKKYYNDNMLKRNIYMESYQDVRIIIFKKIFSLTDKYVYDLCRQYVFINYNIFIKKSLFVIRSAGISIDSILDTVIKDKYKFSILQFDGVIDRLIIYMRLIGISIDDIIEEISRTKKCF